MTSSKPPVPPRSGWGAMLRLIDVIENAILLVCLAGVVVVGVFLWVFFSFAFAAAKNLGSTPEPPPVVSPATEPVVVQALPVAPVVDPIAQLEPASAPAPIEAEEDLSRGVATPVEAVVVPVVANVTNETNETNETEPTVITKGVTEPDGPPPGDPADYQWVKGWQRSNGTYLKGYWKKTVAQKQKAAPRSPTTVAPNRSMTVAEPPPSSAGKVWVNGYTRKDGTKVRGYWRSK